MKKGMYICIEYWVVGYFVFISVYWIKGYIGIYICNKNVDIESIGWIIYWILW